MKGLVAILLLVSLVACASTVQTIEARNSSSRTVSDFTLQDPRGRDFRFGTLPPGIWGTYGGLMTVKSKDVYSVKWTDAEGRAHRVELDIRKEMPNGVRGGVIFVLNDDGTVSVRPRKSSLLHTTL